MAKLSRLFAPVVATLSPEPGPVPAGTIVTIDTNVAARVIYTLDGSRPTLGAVGTFAAEAPVEVLLAVGCTLRYQAQDTFRPNNYTRFLAATYTIVRHNPLEAFRDRKHFFNRLRADTVDANFYPWVEGWTVPKSDRPYTFLFRNPETIVARVRVIHNGRDVLPGTYPALDFGEAAEFAMLVAAGDNTVEIQTRDSIQLGGTDETGGAGGGGAGGGGAG